MVNREAIKLRREGLGLSMAEAAKRAGFSGRQQWNSIESGTRPTPSADSIFLMARALQCTMDELMLPPKTKPAATKKSRGPG